MRAFRMVFAAALPFEIRSLSRARSSASSLTTNFLLATACPLVGYSPTGQESAFAEKSNRPSSTHRIKRGEPLGRAPASVAVAVGIVVNAHEHRGGSIEGCGQGSTRRQGAHIGRRVRVRAREQALGIV